MYTHTHISICVHVYMYMCVHIYIYIHICICICICVCICIRIRTCICVCICICVRIYIYMFRVAEAPLQRGGAAGAGCFPYLAIESCTPSGVEVLHCLLEDISRPDVTPCRTSLPMELVRTCVARNARCNTMSHLTAVGCTANLPTVPVHLCSAV